MKNLRLVNLIPVGIENLNIENLRKLLRLSQLCPLWPSLQQGAGSPAVHRDHPITGSGPPSVHVNLHGASECPLHASKAVVAAASSKPMSCTHRAAVGFTRGLFGSSSPIGHADGRFLPSDGATPRAAGS